MNDQSQAQASVPAGRGGWLTAVFALLAVGGLIAAAVLLFTAVRNAPDLTIAVPGDGIEITGPDLPIPAELSDRLKDSLSDLVTAMAAIVTALTGLLGLVATQSWRRREEARAMQSHLMALERERLELERQRLQLEHERLALARERGQ